MRAMQAGGCPIGIYPAYYYSKVLPKYGFKVIDTKDYKKVEAVVQLMVDGKVTSYRVATETDISKMSLATLTKGTSKIKNITYQTAMLLIEWYDKNHEKYGITID